MGSNSWGRCASGSTCFNNTYVSQWTSGGTNGTCVALNSFATGTVARAPYAEYYWYYAAYWGFQLCASG